jgi:hypothetical protein
MTTRARKAPAKAPAAPADNVIPITPPAPTTPATPAPALDLATLAAKATVVDELPAASRLNGSERGTSNAFAALVKASYDEGKARHVGPVPYITREVDTVVDGKTVTTVERTVDEKAMTKLTNAIRNGGDKVGLKVTIRKRAGTDGIDVYFLGHKPEKKSGTAAK